MSQETLKIQVQTSEQDGAKFNMESQDSKSVLCTRISRLHFKVVQELCENYRLYKITSVM